MLTLVHAAADGCCHHVAHLPLAGAPAERRKGHHVDQVGQRLRSPNTRQPASTNFFFGATLNGNSYATPGSCESMCVAACSGAGTRHDGSQVKQRSGISCA